MSEHLSLLLQLKQEVIKKMRKLVTEWPRHRAALELCLIMPLCSTVGKEDGWLRVLWLSREQDCQEDTVRE